jgi:hypothetical protein
LCIMVNPMRNNWHEMPEFIRFVNQHNINIWFNTIHRPAEWAIWPLPAAELSAIYQTISAGGFCTKEDRSSPLSAYNISIYKNLVEVQFKNWWEESIAREQLETTIEELVDEIKAEQLLKEKLTKHVYLTLTKARTKKNIAYKTCF